VPEQALALAAHCRLQTDPAQLGVQPHGGSDKGTDSAEKNISSN